MGERIQFQTKHSRNGASYFMFVLGIAALTGCAGKSADLGANGDTSRSGEPELIGGQPADAEHYRATVGIGNSCTAAKVGPRLFLTAAHCVAVGRAPRNFPLPEGYPSNHGVHDDYLPGKKLSMYWGLDARDDQRGEFTIASTTIHPSWWECPECPEPTRMGDIAADIAVIEVKEETPQIPEARVELGTIATGTAVVKVGWGCEERTNVDATTVQLGRLKTVKTALVSSSEIQRYETRMSDEQAEAMAASYLVTPGRAQDDQEASLCLGDSGGPLYLLDRGESRSRIVGVNSDYSFQEVQDPDDLGGVSWLDWHTRTSLDARYGVGGWLRALHVNTVGGS